jgi:hypothetical protein
MSPYANQVLTKRFMWNNTSKPAFLLSCEHRVNFNEQTETCSLAFTLKQLEPYRDDYSFRWSQMPDQIF